MEIGPFGFSKRKRRIPALLIVSAILILNYQNCAPGFKGAQLQTTSLSSSLPGGSGSEDDGTPAPVDSTYDGKAPGNLTTSQKTIPNSTTPSTLTWDLGTEVAEGTPLSGARLSVQISRFNPADGSTPVYFVTNPTLITGSQALELWDLRIGVDGVRNDVSTTFQGLDLVVPANTTRVLSTATLLHERGSAASQTLSLHLRLLWPDGVPLPTAPTTPTPAPTLNGANLYTQHCASCHGALATSTKRGRTTQQITNSFVTAPSMSFLATVLSQKEVEAIANALK